MDFVVDSLIGFSGSQEEELRDIAGLGLPTFYVTYLPANSDVK